MNYHLEITTKLGCKLACSFCPQKKLVKSYNSQEKLFSIQNFNNILKKLPKNIHVHFSGYAEPFLNKDTAEMIFMAKQQGFTVHLYTTLVGLDEQNLKFLQDLKIDFIKIHVPDKYGMKVDDDLWITLHELFVKLNINNAFYMSMGELTEKVKKYTEQYQINIEMPEMLSRGGLIEKIEIKYLKGKIICAADRWHKNVILPDGNVYACCMDYGLTMPLGNLFNQTYEEIFSKAEQYKQNTNPPENSICRSCEWAREI